MKYELNCNGESRKKGYISGSNRNQYRRGMERSMFESGNYKFDKSEYSYLHQGNNTRIFSGIWYIINTTTYIPSRSSIIKIQSLNWNILPTFLSTNFVMERVVENGKHEDTLNIGPCVDC